MDIMLEIEQKISLLNNSYDKLRVIDPLTKRVLFLSEEETFSCEGSCYDYWGKDQYCKNCIATRAFIENDTFVKLEYNDEFLVLVTATPLYIHEKIYIVELLKDISKTESISKSGAAFNNQLDDVVDKINENYIMDELTGAYNRRYIDERLMVDIHSSELRGIHTGMLLMKIDKFELINKKHGYKRGDMLLKDVYSILINSVRRSTDWIGRFDSESFLIVLTNTDYENTIRVGNKIKAKLDGTTFLDEGENIEITVDFGSVSTSHNLKDLSLIYESLIENLKITQRNYKGKLENFKSIEKNSINIKKLNTSIEELRDTLNELCATSDDEVDYNYKLKVSEYLDDLIVEYMKKISKQTI
jgi:two-component system cell cycle response regulator